MNALEEFRLHLEFFSELGVKGVSRDSDWRMRSSDRSYSPRRGLPTLTEPEVETADSIYSETDSAELRLTVLREELGDCTRCRLASTRTTIVYGSGNPGADLMFVGEAPGRDEDKQGMPFVGRAGQLLTKIIEAIDLKREDVYIANVIKCRPPKNRNPESDEIETCEPYLFGQVDAIQPKVIVALGSFAVRTLLKSDETISKMRGRVFSYRGAHLVPTFHPAYLLRNPEKKREVWEDMKKVRAMLRE